MNQFGLSLSATKFFNNGFQKFFVPVYEIDNVGSYYIGKSDTEITGLINYSINCDRHYHDTTNQGVFNLQVFDQNQNFMQGTFSMTLINKNCEDSIVNITDGKFGFHYY